MRQVDLNCDIGESVQGQAYDVEQDLRLLPFITSVNIACGKHAGDAHTMHILVESALEQGIGIGAHPSYPDPENFGRKEMFLTPAHVYDQVLYQVGALHAFVHVYGSRIHHVKPHGALYNMAARDKTLADAIALAISDFDKQIILYGLSGSELITAGKAQGLQTCSEVFADRSYQPDGSLTPREKPGAIISDLEAAVAQVVMMVKQGEVNSLGGGLVPIVAETICIHSDHLHAAATAARISESLKRADVLIQQP